MLLTSIIGCNRLTTHSNHCCTRVSGNPPRSFLCSNPKAHSTPRNSQISVMALLQRYKASGICNTLVLLMLITFSTLFPASRVYAYYPTEADLRFLPAYCVARYNNDDPAFASVVKKWRNVFGQETWTSFHHYCQGLNYVERGKRGGDPKTREIDYKSGIENLTKHLEIYGPKFPIKAQTLYVIASAYEGLDELGQASNYYRKAIAIKPRFSRAYVALSDIFMETNNLSEAESVIQAGLKKSPKSKALLDRKNKIQELLAVEKK